MEENKKLNLDDEFSFEIKPTKSAIAAVAAGFLVILAGFLAYNLFSKPKTTPTLTPEAAITQEGQPAENTPSVDQNTPAAPANQPAAQPEVKPTPAVAGENTGAWVARAIDSNSLSGDSYTVKSGDTLWEIANGRYGSGFEWKKIADANNVSYNSLGKPLIFPGQVLKLP